MQFAGSSAELTHSRGRSRRRRRPGVDRRIVGGGDTERTPSRSPTLRTVGDHARRASRDHARATDGADHRDVGPAGDAGRSTLRSATRPPPTTSTGTPVRSSNTG